MDGLVTLTIRATPMSEALTEFLKGHLDSIKRLVEGRGETETFGQLEKQQQEQLSSQQLWSRLEELLSKEGPSWSKTAKNLRAFGPRGCGPNLLFDLSGSGYKPYVHRKKIGFASTADDRHHLGLGIVLGNKATSRGRKKRRQESKQSRHPALEAF